MENLESEQYDRTVSILKKSNKPLLMKSVSFIGGYQSISKDTEDSANQTSTVESLPKKIHGNNISSSSNDSNISKQSNNLSVNLAQTNLDTPSKLTDTEHSTEQHKETSYIGWDGYQEKFGDVTSIESIPHCIPPWAKSMRKKYGLSLSSSYSQEYESHDDGEMKDRIKQLMNKYNDLMLVKRVESKKQVVVEQGKNRDDIDTVKSKTMHTRYYLAPLSKGDIKKQEEVDDGQTSTNIAHSSLHSDNISLTKKTSKTQAKREVQRIIHATGKTALERHHGYESKDQRKCQKLTLKNIRDYVNAQSMTPDQRKLHEIIKIETVPSISSEKKDRGPSKYIINVPQNKPADGATVNVIKIKEKRKLRVESVEDVREKITELHYNAGTPQTQEFKKITPDKIREHTIGKTVKSPTETKTFQVTSKTTPHIVPFIDTENNSNKVLMIQYEKKSAKDKLKDAKKPKYTTELLGVRRPALDDSEEMYLYESETCGEKQNEYSTKVVGAHPNLKEKLNSIFEELRGWNQKKKILPDTVCSEAQVKPDQSDYSSQGPLEPIGTDAVSTQAMPDVKSVEIQVRESQILHSGFIAPHPSPHSGYLPDVLLETDERLEKTSKYLIGYAEDQSELDHENKIEKKSFTDGEDTSKQYDEGEKKHEKDSEKYEEKRKSTQLLYQQTEDKDKVDEEIRDELTDKKEVKKESKSTLDELLLDSGELDETLEASPDSKTDETQGDVNVFNEELDVGDQLDKSKDTTIPDQKTVEKSEGKRFSISKDQQTGDDKVQKESIISSKIHLEESTDEKHGHDQEQSKKDITRNLELLDEETGIETSATKIDEDIRSYNLDGFKDTKLTFTSPSKFLHKKNSIRKRLNWSDDNIYLEKHLCPQLVRGLAETAVRRPADPVAFLAHWIYKEYQNREQTEEEAVHQEHRQLERTMCDVQRPTALVQKKFNLKKYPVQQITPISSEKEISEKTLTLESLRGGSIENDIAQEA